MKQSINASECSKTLRVSSPQSWWEWRFRTNNQFHNISQLFRLQIKIALTCDHSSIMNHTPHKGSMEAFFFKHCQRHYGPRHWLLKPICIFCTFCIFVIFCIFCIFYIFCIFCIFCKFCIFCILPNSLPNICIRVTLSILVSKAQLIQQGSEIKFWQVC